MKIKNHHILNIANNLYGWAMSRMLQVNKFKWIKDTSQFDKDFIKNYNEESNAGYFLEVDVQYPKTLHKFHNDLRFLPEIMKINKLEKPKSLLLICITKLNMSFT